MSRLYKWTDAAISCCLTGDSIISTNEGIFSLKEIVGISEKKQGFNNIENNNINVRNINNIDTGVKEVYINGKQDCLTINTELGRDITGTKDHKLLVIVEKNEFE